MGKSSISPSQLLAMIILFEFGTALVVHIGLVTERGAWLSVLIALPGGILLYLIYEYLLRQYPRLILSGYIQKILGKFIGWPLSLLYVALFMYIASGNLRDTGDLLVTATYDRTPLFVINAVMSIAIIFVLSKGIEVLGRLAEIYLLIIISVGIISIILIISSGLIDLKNLLPLFEGEWKNILISAYPNIWMFPFGELIILTTILPHLNKSHLAKRTGIIAITISGLLLSFTHAIEIAVLGEDMYSRATFPLFTAISLVNIADFLQRMDALVMLSLIIGAFFKMTIFCYAAIALAADLFKVHEQKKVVVPIAVIVLFISIISASNFPEHFNEEKITVKIILPIFSAGIPMLLAIVHHIRKRFGLYR
jgi:spore germination protein KB